jgi:hypothetical protein
MTDIHEAAQSDQLRLLDSETGQFAYYAWQNTVIAFWNSTATDLAVQRFTTVVQSMIKEHPEGISNVQLIPVGAGVPTSEARAGFGELIKQYSKNITCVEVVILGGGFWASAMRAAVTGINMIVSHSFPLRIHSRMVEAAKSLSAEHLKKTGAQVDPDKLFDALETVRRQHLSNSPSENK